MENQKKMWNYLNLLANGRDIIKSIIFYLYNVCGLKGKTKTFNQLEEIMKNLKSKKLKIELAVKDEKLNDFLLLSFFLKNYLNKVLHREFIIKEIDDDSKTQFLSIEYSFNSFFDHLKYFLEKTIFEKNIQHLISQALTDYSSDKELSEELKYKEGNIFKKIDDKFTPNLSNEDITEIFKALENIQFNGEKFGKLCEEKKWKDNDEDESIPKIQFYNLNIMKM